MVKFSWKIQSMKTDPATGVVECVWWLLTATDPATKEEQSLHGSYSMAVGEGAEKSKDFVEFGKLSEDMVVKWITDNMPGVDEYKERAAAALQEKLDSLNAATQKPQFEGLPWERTADDSADATASED